MYFIVALLACFLACCKSEVNDFSTEISNLGAEYDQYETETETEGIPIPKFKRVNITAADGINIEAIVFDSKNPLKKNPAIIFISSWALNKYEYIWPAKEYSDKGYTVVSYTARGFWGSSQRHNQPGGQINLAGPLDIADISTVIDWMLKNTNADPNRIGSAGISYGAGLSLLGSAFDSRIKSVVAMSGWVDLAQSLLGQGYTIRSEAVKTLDLSARLTGTVGEDLDYLFTNYYANTNLDSLVAITTNSSAGNFIKMIQANKPSIFIANAYSDSFFTPNQFPSFFNALTGPKHMEFAPGDHAGPEMGGLFPQKTNISKIFSHLGNVWERSFQWFDFYLMQAQGQTPFTGYAPVIFNTITTNNTLDSYNSWADVTSSTKKFSLDKLGRLSPKWIPESTSLRGAVDAPISSEGFTEVSTITTGYGTISGGIALVSATVEALIDKCRPFDLKRIDSTFAAVFTTDRHDFYYIQQHIRGIPTLKLNIIPPGSSGTVVVYLLDVHEGGQLGFLISFAPYTFSNAKPGKQMTLNFEITMTSYNLKPGHRLALVVGTHDSLFLDQNPTGQPFKIMSDSELVIPLHN
jgi:predicted acyl esterase